MILEALILEALILEALILIGNPIIYQTNSIRDIIHDAVRIALEKENWLTEDLYKFRFKNTRVEIDIKAEKLLDEVKKIQCILLEVKTLGQKSVQYEFYHAYGQYSFYKYLLKRKNIERELYLAISLTSYERIKQVDALREWIVDEKINFVIVDIENQETLQWINY